MAIAFTFVLSTLRKSSAGIKNTVRWWNWQTCPLVSRVGSYK